MSSTLSSLSRLFIVLCIGATSLLLSSGVFAQTVISGLVKDLTKQDPVISAQVFVYRATDQKLIGSTISDYDGNYKLTIEEPGEVRIEVSALFYQLKVKTLELSGGSREINFSLSSKSMELKEVSITAKRPVKINNDTTVYDAAYFARGDEVVAEDLLRSIPGISVSQDGKITVRGREVEKVMIDSDDFFEKGYRTVTKSLRAAFIEQVEVLDNYSNISLLKGYEKSDKVAINLKLSEAARSQIFGDIMAAGDVASFKRYETQLDLINLRGPQKLYALVSANNIGAPPLDAIDNLWATTPLTDNSLINYQEGSASLVSMSNQQPSFRHNRTVDSQNEVVSVSGILHLGEKVKVRPLFSGFLEDQASASSRTDIFQVNDQATITNNRSTTNDNRIRQQMGRVDIYADIDKTRQLTSRTSFRIANNDFENGLVINDQANLETLGLSQKSISQRITYLQTISTKTALLLTAFGGMTRRDEQYNISNNQFQPLLNPTGSGNSLQQTGETQNHHLQIESHLFLKGNEEKDNGIEFLAGIEARGIELLQSFTATTSENPFFSRLDDGPAEITMSNQNVYLVAVHSGATRKIDYQLKFGGHLLSTTGDKLLTDLIPVRQFALLPSLKLKYRAGKKNHLELNVSRSFTNPEITDVFPSVYTQSNSMLRTGMEDLSPLLASQVSLTHFHGHFSDRFSLISTLGYQYHQDYLSAQTAILGAFAHQKVVRFSGRKAYQFSSAASQFFPELRNSLKFTAGLSRASYSDRIVGLPNDRDILSTNGSAGVEIRSTFTGVFNYHIGMTFSKSVYGGDANGSFRNRRIFTDLSFKVGKRFRANTMAESFLFANDASARQQLWLLDGGADYDLVPKKISCTLRIRNLLDTKSFQTIENTAILYSENSYHLLPRMILIGIKAII
jgi:hypothetical protein